MNLSLQSEVEAVELEAPVVRSESSRQFSDLDLQLCRRLDWRFLLPNSDLGNVAYLGREKTSLAAALARFSRSLSIVSSGKSARIANVQASKFDLVVVSLPTLSNFSYARELLRDGGYLYAEVGLSASRIKGLSAHRTDLVRAGFGKIQTYWHRPNFERCREIVPLENKFALDYVLSRRQADMAGRIKSFAGRLAQSTGLLGFVMPSVSLLACKTSEAQL